MNPGVMCQLCNIKEKKITIMLQFSKLAIITVFIIISVILRIAFGNENLNYLPFIISNLKNNQLYFPEMNFRAIMCRPYRTLLCPVGTANNSAAIYCRVMIQV